MREAGTETPPGTQPLPAHVRVAIIGAGFAGIGAAIRLRQAGRTDFVILERAGAVGGTWRDNTYPGCTCDVPSHLYSFSFAPNPDWSRGFSRQPEIWAYLDAVTDRYAVRPYIRFGTELAEARWDGGQARWQLRTSRGDLTADVVIAAAGPLSTPSLPDIPGLDTFPGEIFHSARWDHQADLAGKRIAVIGTGASAIQIVPAIQPAAGRLTLFQRTPAWVMPRRDRRITDAEKWLYRQVPLTERMVRLGLHASRELLVLGFVKRPGLLRGAQRMALRHLARSVPDPDLRARLTPRYVLGCKRVLLSNDYYPALTQPNTELVAAGLAKVDGSTLTAQDGTARDADVIVFATGFHVIDMPLARRITGAGGVTLAQTWGEDMRALRGTTIAGFPNLCLLIGPNTGLGHNSLIHIDRGPARLHPGLPGRAGPAGRGRPGHQPGGRAALVRRRAAPDGVHGMGHRRLHELVPELRGPQPDAVARVGRRVPPRDPPAGPGRVSRHPGRRRVTAGRAGGPAGVR